MPKKIVMDIEELERHMTVTEWLDISRACQVVHAICRDCDEDRALHYERLALKAEHRSSELMHGRVIP